MNPKSPILIVATLLASAVCMGSAPAYMPKEHVSAVERWLQSRPDLRLATDGDCQCDRDLVSMRSESSNQHYQPYYAAADFNDDGQKDFAIVAITRVDPSRKILIVFNGPVVPSTNPAYIGSAEGILVLSRPSSPPQRLLVGRPYADAAVLTPIGKSYSLIWPEP